LGNGRKGREKGKGRVGKCVGQNGRGKKETAEGSEEKRGGKGGGMGGGTEREGDRPILMIQSDYTNMILVEVKRRRGRPRTAWMDNIKTWTGLPVEESIRITEDRDKWRKYVHGVANPRIEDG